MKALFVSLGALALAQGASSAEIKVSYSEDFAEKLTEDYGEREGEFLTKEITKDLTKALEKKGVDVALIEVTIIDAKPTRPTFKQAGDEPGLDTFRSISLGGMDLEATAFDAEGDTVTSLSYDWFEHDLRNSIAGTTWSDADRASRVFAKKLAKQLAEVPTTAVTTEPEA